MQIVKAISKHVTSKFSVQKQQFYAQFEIFLKTKIDNGFIRFRGTFAYKLCPNFFIEAFNYQKYTIFLIVQK